jgi:hypothetical protein
VHIVVSGFTDFGSGIGTDFRATHKKYDGSAYTGVRFWAKVGEGKNAKHRVQLADASTDAAGGKCDDTGTAANDAKCGNHFGLSETFTTSWAKYEVTFAQLTQQDGWGNTAAALDATELYGFQVTAKAKADVDLWLDQVEFF